MPKRKTPIRREHELHLKMLLPAFGEKVATLRRAKGWTQTFASAMIGISNSQLHNIENGNCWPSMPVYITLLKVYGQGKAVLL